MNVSSVEPTAMLIVEAFMEQRIDHEELVEWAEALDVPSEQVSKAFAVPGDDFWSPLMPRPDGCSRCVRCTQAAIAFAYAHGRVGFDEALDWAAELGLDRQDTIRLVERCAEAGHGVGSAECGCAS